MNTSIIISNTTVNNGTMTGNAQHMTSLEIAEVTGKQHKHVMEAIRKMEPAWMNIAGSNFRLGSYKDANRQLRPCYKLTKTECLYIATKFNDEARAKLVLRWEELEKKSLTPNPSPVGEGRYYGQKLLISDNDILKESENIMGRELEILNGDPKDYITTTDIAKSYGLEPGDLISFLRDMKVLMPRGRQRLTSQYAESGLAENRHCRYYSLRGELKESIYLVWTMKGAEFIHKLIEN